MPEARRILVPVHGHEADDEALRLAISIAKRDKGRVFLVYVVEVERSLPLDAPAPAEAPRAGTVLDRMEAIGKKEKFPVEAELLQAREAGPAVVEEAIERNADLIVMGLPFRRHQGEFSLGTTVPYVLLHAPCRVWVCREPPAVGEPGMPVGSGGREAHR